MYNEKQLIEILNRLRMMPSETEIVEFKKAENSFPDSDLGQYFSALSNEANLKESESAWLVFGVDNKTHELTNSLYKNSRPALDEMKKKIADQTTNRITFDEIYAFTCEGKRVVMFEIPAAPKGIPIAYQGHYYGRDGESLVALNLHEIELIRSQARADEDWSARIVEEATLEDLDELAMAKARIMFKKVHERIPASEVDGWTAEEFLCHSEVMRDGKLTRAAILLLGKKEALAKIHPVVAQITWSLVDEENVVQDYEHFTIPFILTVDEVLAKIRNLTMRELPGGTLFPDTMKQYDDYTIREALHNCIAHQDYTMRQRINFVEGSSTLYYSNGGSFIPGTLQEALEHKGPQRFYRNTCLCTGMVNFNMIDTVGRGIKKMFAEQKRRFFPMPDYEIDNVKREVGVTIYGKMLDERYTKALKERTDLTMRECIMLDAVQKGMPLTEDARKYLKGKKLIEGKAPKLIISLSVAKMTHQLGEYTKLKGMDIQEREGMVLSLARKAGADGFKRQDAYVALERTLPIDKTADQKLRIVGDLLLSMSRKGLITSIGKRWIIAEE